MPKYRSLIRSNLFSKTIVLTATTRIQPRQTSIWRDLPGPSSMSQMPKTGRIFSISSTRGRCRRKTKPMGFVFRRHLPRVELIENILPVLGICDIDDGPGKSLQIEVCLGCIRVVAVKTIVFEKRFDRIRDRYFGINHPKSGLEKSEP